MRAIVRPGRRCAVPDGVEPVAAPVRRCRPDARGRGRGCHRSCGGPNPSRDGSTALRGECRVTRHVVQAAVRLDARLVHVSSLAAAGPGTPERPRAEDDTPCPLTAYGRSKLAAEELVRTSAGLHWTIVRPALVYGPADRNMLPLFRFARRGLVSARSQVHGAGLHVRARRRCCARHRGGGDGGRGRTPGVRARASEERDGGHPDRHAGARPGAALPPGGFPYALLLAGAVGGEVAKLCGGRWRSTGPGSTELMADGWVCSVEKARDRLGVSARIDLLEGFTSTAAWYARHGLLDIEP